MTKMRINPLKLTEALLKNYSTTELVEPSYAVAIILSEDDKILFIERATRVGDNWSGQMAFPGGKKEAGDTNLLLTATRETKEEVGVRLTQENCLGGLMDIGLRKRGLPTPGTLFSYVFTTEDKKIVLDTSEVKNAYWVDLEYLLDPCNIGEYTYRLNEIKITLPCIIYKDKQIWGLTFQLLTHFLISYKAAGQID